MRALQMFLSLVLLASSASCAGMTNPLVVASVQGCVKKNCDERDAVAYQACEASCRQRYGR